MALVLMEGFDVLTAAYIQSKYPLGNYFGADTTTGRYAGQGFRPGPGNQNGEWTVSTGGLGTFAFGCGINVPLSGFGTGINLVRFNNSAGNRQFTIGLKADGSFVVAAGATLTSPLATSATGLVTSSSWFYLECEFVLSDTVGECRLYINGAKVIDISGVDTKGSTTTVVDELRFGMVGTGGGGLIVDDFYLTNTAARLGESRIVTLVPTSDTADKDWGRSTGSDNYALVDEAPFNSDTDYLTSSTVGDLDYYGLSNLTYDPVSIHAVQTSIIARKDDAASRSVRSKLKSGATVANGADLGLSASYIQRQDLYVTDPATGAAWTRSAVDALVVGIETTA